MNLHYFITFSSRGSGVCRSLFLRTFMVMILFITGSNGIYAGVEINGERTITVDGKTRKYWLYVPASVEGQENVPVVFSLHGRYGTDDPNDPGKPLFTSLAKEKNFIVVYPQGRDAEKIKQTIPVTTGRKVLVALPVGKPLEKRMQILSLSRHLWIRYRMTTRQRTLPTAISPSIRRGSTSVDSPWAA